MMRVTLAPVGEGSNIAVLRTAAEHARWLAFFADPIALEIAQVCREGH